MGDTLMDEVSTHLNLLERDYFGLSYVDEGMMVCILRETMTIYKWKIMMSDRYLLIIILITLYIKGLKQCCTELPLFLFSLCHVVKLVHYGIGSYYSITALK